MNTVPNPNEPTIADLLRELTNVQTQIDHLRLETPKQPTTRQHFAAADDPFVLAYVIVSVLVLAAYIVDVFLVGLK